MNPFHCRRCGNCCKVSGYVRLQEEEVRCIADRLGISLREFTREYTRLTDDRRGLSLKERADASCIFLVGRGECAIQDVKPLQCRTFPVAWRFDGWEHLCQGDGVNKTSKP